MWEIKIQHKELGKYRTIRDADRHVADQKADAQLRAWDEQWERKRETERKRQARFSRKKSWLRVVALKIIGPGEGGGEKTQEQEQE